MTITKNKSDIAKSEQIVLNKSFDDDFDVVAVELLGYESGGDALHRVATDTDGHLQVDVLSGGGGGTQYTEGDTDTTITGTAILWEDTSNTLKTVNANDPLPVAIISGAGSGGTASDDDADFTAGTTAGTPSMGVYESSPSSVTDGDLGIVGITQTRSLKVLDDNSAEMNTSLNEIEGAVETLELAHVQVSSTDLIRVGLFDDSDTQITSFGGGTEFDEDTQHTTGDAGKFVLAVRNDTLAALAGTDGDYAPFQVNASGALFTDIADGGQLDTLLDTLIADVDGVETLLGTIDADTSTLAGAVSGGQFQVDIVADGAGLLTSSDFAAAFGTAGTADSQVMSIQGIASMTPVIVDLGSNNDVTLATLPDTSSGDLAAITVATEATQAAVEGTLTVGSHAVTNAGTFAVQVDGDALTALQLIDNIVLAEDSAHQTADPGVQLLAVRKATPADLSGTDGDYEPLQIDNGRLWTSTTIDAALPAGTNAIGKLAANSGVDIGDVDVLSSALPTGASTASNQSTIIGHVDGIETLLGTIDTDTGNIATSVGIMDDWDNAASDGASVSGDVAHDSSDAGEPVKIGAKAYSPDGTTPGTAVAEGDRTNAKSDLDGALFVRTTQATRGHKHLDGSTAYTDESLVADPGDGFQVIIDFIEVSTGAATAMNFFLEEGSTKIWGPVYIEAVAGRGYVSGPIHLPVTASTAVTITTSASIAQSIDVLYHIEAV